MSQPDTQPSPNVTSIQAGRDVELEIRGDFVEGTKIGRDQYNTYGLTLEKVAMREALSPLIFSSNSAHICNYAIFLATYLAHGRDTYPVHLIPTIA